MNNSIREQLEKSIFDLLNEDNDVVVKGIDVNGINIYLSSTRGERKTNQDRVIVVNASNIVNSRNNIVLALIADGMGGMVEGEKAASIAISSFVACFCTSKINGIKSSAIEAIKYCNSKVHSQFNGRGGTTLSGLIIGQHGIIGLNVGDSRIYEITDNKSIIKLTRDDTIAGQLVNDNDGTWLKPSKADNRLVQYIGMGDDIVPHIIDLSSAGASTFLLTTDGVHYVGTQMMNKIVSKCKSDKEIVERISYMSQWIGGHDNGTIVIVPSRLQKNLLLSNQDATKIIINTLNKPLTKIYPTCHYILPEIDKNISAADKTDEINNHKMGSDQLIKKRKYQKKKKEPTGNNYKQNDLVALEFIDVEVK